MGRYWDIVIKSWYTDKPDDGYMDITIGNIFCQTYISGAAKEMFYVTNIKEKQKYQKYPNVPTLEPMVMDTMGGFGKIFKRNLQKIAHKLALLKPYAIIINRLRTKLTAMLHQQNAKMIIASMPF